MSSSGHGATAARDSYRGLITFDLASRAGSAVGSRRTAELLGKFGIHHRTATTKISQRKCWLEFCAADKLKPVPVNEAGLLGFIRWLIECREAWPRKVSAASLPHYISAIHTTHRDLCGSPPPPFPNQRQILKAYKTRESSSFPSPSLRAGISAAIVYSIYQLGMRSSYAFTILDVSIVVFAFTLSGLSNYTVDNLLDRLVPCSPSLISMRFSYWKGRAAGLEPPITYYRISEENPSPIDLLCRCKQKHSGHRRFFGL